MNLPGQTSPCERRNVRSKMNEKQPFKYTILHSCSKQYFLLQVIFLSNSSAYNYFKKGLHFKDIKL